MRVKKRTNVGSFREKFGLDWMRQQPLQPSYTTWKGINPPARATPDLTDYVLAYGAVLLLQLEGKPEGKAHLHDLVKGMNLRLRDALPVFEFLCSKGLVEKLEDDAVVENHLVRLTDSGREFVKKFPKP